ncbi:hypothetical protein [Bacillus thuringiensis]|uniref:hypothetical protein n=1 Tax=Bacillus thuringiensis TaxID=1428 RepID=UPI003BF80071
MKDTSKKQIIKVFLISILGLGTILGMLYFNHKTNIQQNKAQATEKRVLQYDVNVKMIMYIFTCLSMYKFNRFLY